MGKDQGTSPAPAWASCSGQGRACVGWVERFFKDCVCSAKDEVSFGVGMASLVFWGIAEIPQIVTNYQTKSGHGVSLGLLLTWVVGDAFNLVGCLLEPATLPTQLYTALLYTAITVVLVLQTLYYDYALRWWKYRRFQRPTDDSEVDGGGDPVKEGKTGDPTTPILLPVSGSTSRRDVCYTSARSLTNSGTPTFGSYLGVRSNPAGRGPGILIDSDDDASDEEATPAPQPGCHGHSQHPGAVGTGRRTSRSVGYGTFLGVSASLPFQTKAAMIGTHMVVAKKILQLETGIEDSAIGLWLGWIMAGIYMGGRLPQIFLNIKRGSVEGLNPLMFVLALLANVTYVGSILVRSTEWSRIKANAPWLLDAAVCVLLDLFILLQFAYYKHLVRRSRPIRQSTAENFGDYEEIKKPSSRDP